MNRNEIWSKSDINPQKKLNFFIFGHTFVVKISITIIRESSLGRYIIHKIFCGDDRVIWGRVIQGYKRGKKAKDEQKYLLMSKNILLRNKKCLSLQAQSERSGKVTWNNDRRQAAYLPRVDMINVGYYFLNKGYFIL